MLYLRCMKKVLIPLTCIMFFISSCYKEEHKIVEKLKGKYQCLKTHPYYAIGQCCSGIDSSIVSIEFCDVIAYPRKMQVELEEEKTFFILDFNHLSFDADSKKNSYNIEGKFYGNDSIYFIQTEHFDAHCKTCGAFGAYSYYVGRKI